MALKCGIVGLPNVGKSTLFNCLSNAKAQSANFPFCTIEPNLGTISVPDKRLTELEKLVNPERVMPTTIEIVDIAGLVKGASKGEGLGNKFLANIRETDAIIHVLRCFDDDNIVHVDGSVDPVRDKEIIDIELQMKDLEAVESKIKSLGKAAASGDKTELTEYKEYTSKDGKKISPEEIKGDLTKMSNKTEMYSSIFDGDTAKAHEDIKDMAKKYDFDLEDPKYKERKAKSIASAIAYVKRKNQDIDEDMLKAQYEAYYDLGNIYANTYNTTADSQMFTNEVWKYDKKEGKAKVDRTDGLDTLSLLKFEFNIGFSATGRPSNPVPTRFKNQKGEE